MDEITKEFLVESHESLDRLERDLVSLEKDPREQSTLASIFRTIHTIKGSSGFLSFEKLEAVAHVAENLLSKMRDGVLTINPELTSALLATGDAIRVMLTQIEATGHPGDKDFSELIAWLTKLNEGNGHQSAPAAEAIAPEAVITKPLVVEATASEVTTPEVVVPEVAVSEAVAPEVVIPEVVAAESLVPEAVVPQPIVAAPTPSPAPKPVLPVQADSVESSVVEEPTPEPVATLQDLNETRNSVVSESNIRVDVGLLDKLMNLVGELVLARNQVLQFAGQRDDNAFLATSQRLNLITTELQASVMKTRMQPIGNVWSKLPRVVRDLATMCGKQVHIDMVGKDTELDKTIVEAIKDPLTHIVRNSVDHGIETPEVRASRNKPAEGRLSLRAYHQGGQVNIEITDDGSGIDCERVKQKCMQKGLITAEQASRMTDHEAMHLIFLPGFSTAERVTNVSGRGVGMDVVKTNIERIGGTVDIQSVLGEGTTLKIKIPLTLAIIPALTVTSGGDRFAIPQVSLLELVRLESEQAKRQIEMIDQTPIYRLRGQLLPLAYLNRELQIGDALSDTDAVNIVVLQADGRPFGLVVDTINDTEEIVVKPLGKQLKGVTCLAGATIMGDGRVALILDVLGIAQAAGIVRQVREHAALEAASQERKAVDNRQTLLLFDAGQGSRMAIPLSMVARLEEIPRSMVEYSGSQRVVRYRGQILPLISVADHIPAVSEMTAEAELMQVIVYAENGRSIGIVVGKIHDIVHETITAKRHAHANGIYGSVVIQEKVTDLLDVQSLLKTADPSFAGAASRKVA